VSRESDKAARGVANLVLRAMATEKRAAEYGIVRAVVPLEVELTTADIVIDSDELVVSQEVRQYDRDVGIAVGDTIVLVPAMNEELVAVAVISETPLKSHAEQASKSWVADAITAAVSAALVTAGAAAWSPGDLKPTARSTEPAGWLLCDGRAVSRVTYAALFAVIGTSYGPGDTTTTFNLPDGRGRFFMGALSATGPVGANGLDTVADATTHALGTRGGTETVRLTIGQMPAHDHGGSTGTANAAITINNTTANIQTASATGTIGTTHVVLPVGYASGTAVNPGDLLMNAQWGTTAGTGATGYNGTQTDHSHTFTPTAHDHTVDPHAHTITQTAHSHSIGQAGNSPADPHANVGPFFTGNWLVKT
jgi:microcystin-dependent protein